MSRRGGVALALAALACGLLGAFLLGRDGSPLGRAQPALPQAARVEPDTKADAPLAATPTGAARESVASAEPRPLDVQGEVTFMDGVPADGFPLKLRVAGDPAQDRPIVTSDSGTFELAELDPGRSYVLSADADGMRRSLGELAVGDERRTWVLPALRVRIQTLGDGGEPIPLARVSLARRLAPLEQVSGRRTLVTDSQGMGAVYLEEPGFAELHAVDAEQGLYGRMDSIPVQPGVSRETQRVILRPMDAGAALKVRVVCRGCGHASPFLCRMWDEESDLTFKMLHTEDVGADGLLHGLPEGTFQVELYRRYRWPLGFYPFEDTKRASAVTLSAGAVAEVRFDVSCGARLQLRVLDDASPAASAGSFTVTLAPDGVASSPVADPKPCDLTWRTGDLPERWTVGASAPLGVLSATDPAVPPGLYRVTVGAKGFEERNEAVALEPCSETLREVRLRRATAAGD